MKLSKMEQRLLNVMGGEYVGSAILMDRLYAGLRRPKTSTISPMIRRLRAKGVQIESVRGKGYRMALVGNSRVSTGFLVAETVPQTSGWSV